MSSVVADSGPNAGSNLVHGVGTNAVTFTLPGSPRYKVESVVATVDNSAGGDATGTLTVADQSGEFISAGEQGRVVSAGVTGSATWALRLNDETRATADVVLISAVDLTANGTIIFAVPQTYRHLQLRASLRGAAQSGLGRGYMGIRFNGDTANDYYTYDLETVPGGAGRVTQTDSCEGCPGFQIPFMPRAATSGDPVEDFAALVVDITAYARDDRWKMITFSAVFQAGGDVYTQSGGGIWKITDPVAEVKVYSAQTVSANLLAGSMGELFGLR